MNNHDITNEQQKFFKLLEYSNELKRNKDCLETKDFEAFKILLKFLVRIENNLHYSEKEEYIRLVKDFLADKISADDFSYSFMAIYEGINKICSQLEEEKSPELATFLKPCRSELGKLLMKIYGSCDAFSPDSENTMSNEQELKDYAQILLLELQYQLNYE